MLFISSEFISGSHPDCLLLFVSAVNLLYRHNVVTFSKVLQWVHENVCRAKLHRLTQITHRHSLLWFNMLLSMKSKHILHVFYPHTLFQFSSFILFIILELLGKGSKLAWLSFFFFCSFVCSEVLGVDLRNLISWVFWSLFSFHWKEFLSTIPGHHFSLS